MAQRIVARRCESGGTPPYKITSKRIKDLEGVRRYIDKIDFTMAKKKLCSSEEGDPGWSAKKANFVEKQYKNWLFLRRKYENELMPPDSEIDEFWHAHLLDTFAYHRDTSAIFGHYFHHFPYFGMGGKADYARLQRAFQNTLKRHREEYSEELVGFCGKASSKPKL